MDALWRPRTGDEPYGLESTVRSVELRYSTALPRTIDVVMPTTDGPSLVPMRSTSAN
jgi:hypothetical protein